jgi:hypothetical protein
MSEPLLGVEPEGPSKKTLFLALGIGAVALVAVAVALVVSFRKPPPPPESPEAPVAVQPKVARPKTEATRESSGEDRRAKELYDLAEAFERAEPAEYEKRIARWKDVVTGFPTSTWARKADERLRTASASLQTFLEREFESTRKDAQSLSAAGHYVDAIETIQNYKTSQTRDALKRRADLEIGAIQNACRLNYNEASTKAKDLATKGDYAAAQALFESLGGSAIPEVAVKCRTAVEQLTAAGAAQARHAELKKGEDARKAFRLEVAPKLLGFVRARQYEEALKELSAASALPANAVLKDEIGAERAAIADASSFWDAFLKTAKSKVGQDTALLLADGKKLGGKIARLQADRIVLESGDEALMDKLHADLLVGWTLGRSLAAEEAVSYVKAALFFFCEGRDDLARLYLATAKEMNGRIDDAEKVFREGFIRSATRK